MNAPLPHERPALLLLPRGADVGAALVQALTHPEVKVSALPPLWFLDPFGIDLVAALPDTRALTLASLPQVLAALERSCTTERLQELAQRLWREADERLRQHFLGMAGLGRGALGSLGALFGLGRKTRDSQPPEVFVSEQVVVQRLECQYRLAPEPGAPATPAPPEEGSLVVYPFDLRGVRARRELGLAADGGPVIELFAYAWQHPRHEAFWQRLARDLGGELRGV